jgi:integrase
VVTLPLLGRVLRSIFAEQAPTRLDARDALLMVFLTVQRRDTVINMEWTEIDWQHREWRIPKDKMKKCGDVQAEHDHVVPLPQMAIDLLTIRWAAREMGKRKSRFVFPSRTLTNDFDSVDAKTGLKVAARGQSDTLMQELLNDNNWKGIHTTHGTRTSFRTIVVKEFGDIIMVAGKAYMTHLLCEIQLAHMNGEKMKEITANMPGTYYENDALVERRALMDKWAELIAKLLTETGPEEIGFMREQAALAAPTLSIAA